MKITKEKNFSSYSLKIVIESKDEEDVLKTLFGADITIPEALKNMLNDKGKDFLYTFLNSTYNLLVDKNRNLDNELY